MEYLQWGTPATKAAFSDRRLPDRRGIVAHEWPPLSFTTATSDATDIDVIRPDRKYDINVCCARTGFAHRAKRRMTLLASTKIKDT